MKKAYSKPHIVFDSFELSQSIASCKVMANAAAGTCSYWDAESGLSIFTSTITTCSDFPQPGTNSEAQFGKICYEVPTGNWNLFSS